MKKRPIVIDLFCGAGGESQGIHDAFLKMNVEPKVYAVNHWETACNTHSLNFPQDEVLCQDTTAIDPKKLIGDEKVALLWASPECQSHSVARGGQPKSDQSRSTAWDVLRWASMLRPSKIIVENVPEFVNWGPLDANGISIKSICGNLFKAFINSLKAMGYKVDWKILCAADYGAPTTRRRLFLQASLGRIIWPTPTHTEEVNLLCNTKWVPVKDVLDWSIPKRPFSERTRPLADSTVQKVFDGALKFWSKDKCEPFIARFNSGSNRVHSIHQPLPTLDCSNRYALVEPKSIITHPP